MAWKLRLISESTSQYQPLPPGVVVDSPAPRGFRDGAEQGIIQIKSHDYLVPKAKLSLPIMFLRCQIMSRHLQISLSMIAKEFVF